MLISLQAEQLKETNIKHQAEYSLTSTRGDEGGLTTQGYVQGEADSF